MGINQLSKFVPSLSGLVSHPSLINKIVCNYKQEIRHFIKYPLFALMATNILISLILLFLNQIMAFTYTNHLPVRQGDDPPAELNASSQRNSHLVCECLYGAPPTP